MKSQKVIVTGGGRGIGAAVASLFAESGASVLIASRSENELASTKNSILKNHPDAEVYTHRVDVGNQTSVQELFEYAQSVMGGVSVLINNAARIEVEDFTDISLESWQRTMDVNLTGSFLCAQEAFKLMKGRGGSITNLSSLGGIQNTEKFKGFLSYSVSKFGIVGLTECLAVEGKEFGIRVNCVAPGAVDTQMLKKAAPFLMAEAVPDDIAQIILFLSDEARAKTITGSVIEVKSNA